MSNEDGGKKEKKSLRGGHLTSEAHLGFVPINQNSQ